MQKRQKALTVKMLKKKSKMTVSVLEFKKYKYLPQLFNWNFHNEQKRVLSAVLKSFTSPKTVTWKLPKPLPN